MPRENEIMATPAATYTKGTKHSQLGLQLQLQRLPFAVASFGLVQLSELHRDVGMIPCNHIAYNNGNQCPETKRGHY